MESSPTDTKYQPTHFGLLDSELLQLLQLEERAIFKDKRASCDLQISAKVLFNFLTSFFFTSCTTINEEEISKILLHLLKMSVCYTMSIDTRNEEDCIRKKSRTATTIGR